MLEFRAHDRKVALRSVRFVGDSVTGVSWGHPDSPLEAYAIADVSYARITKGDQGVKVLFGNVFLGMFALGLAFGIIVCHGYCSGD